MLVKLKAKRTTDTVWIVCWEEYETNMAVSWSKWETYYDWLLQQWDSRRITTKTWTYNISKTWFDVLSISAEDTTPKVQRVLLRWTRNNPYLESYVWNNIYAYACWNWLYRNKYEWENFSKQVWFIDIYEWNSWVVYKWNDKIYVPKDWFVVEDIENVKMCSIKKEYEAHIAKIRSQENVLDFKPNTPMQSLNELVKHELFPEDVQKKFIDKAKETTLEIKKLEKTMSKANKILSEKRQYLEELNRAYEEKDADFMDE